MCLESKSMGAPVFLPRLLPIYISTQECLPGLGIRAQAFLYTRRRNNLLTCVPGSEEWFIPGSLSLFPMNDILKNMVVCNWL